MKLKSCMFQNILIWGAHETGTLLADDIMGNVMSLQKPPVVKPSLSLAQLIYHCNPPTETIAINQMNKLNTCMFSECPNMEGPRSRPRRWSTTSKWDKLADTAILDSSTSFKQSLIQYAKLPMLTAYRWRIKHRTWVCICLHSLRYV